jgi:hypothetical protein
VDGGNGLRKGVEGIGCLTVIASVLQDEKVPKI